MYASVHQTGGCEAGGERLLTLGRQFSPSVEITDRRTVTFSLAGLGRLIGGPEEIAAEICRRGAEAGLIANLAVASKPDAAVLAAKVIPGVTVIPEGEEARFLGRIPLEDLQLDEDLLGTLERWGLKTLDDVAALPPVGLAERLGQEGVRLHNLALGRLDRPLRLEPPEPAYSSELELEESLEELEPLLFLLARLLNDLCRRLGSRGRATSRIETQLKLVDGRTHQRILELPLPQNEANSLLKLVRLDLEAHPAPAAVIALRMELHPAERRPAQGGLFVPLAPEPERLLVTLARLERLAGQGNVGSPKPVDTHRPDTFRLQRFRPVPEAALAPEHSSETASMVLRVYRPPRPAKVRLRRNTPEKVAARQISGTVVEAAGPWRSTGGWWDKQAWAQDEWDVELTDGAVYRLYQELRRHCWFVRGVYD